MKSSPGHSDRNLSGWWALAALLVVLLTPIWWGADPTYPWDSDNIAPGSVLKGLAARFAPGWYSVYGPLPYYLVATAYVPFLAILKLTGELGTPSSAWPFGFRHPDLAVLLLVVVARLVTVLTALGSAWVAMSHATRSGIERGRWLTPLLLLGSIEFIHRGRTTNVDSYFLFFLWLAITIAESRPRSLRSLSVASSAAAFAVCCKEQAAPMSAAIIAGAAWWAFRFGDGALLRRLARPVVVGLAALAAYAAAWMLPFNVSGWRAHHEFLFRDALGSRRYELSPSGVIAQLGDSLQWAPLAWGYPILLGLLLAVILRPKLPDLRFRLFCVLAYLAGFLVKIGYTFPRFLLPLLVLLVPIAVAGWDQAFERVRERRVPRAMLAAVLGVLLLTGGPTLAWLQWTDSRLPAERWIREHARPGSLIELTGNGHLNVRVPREHRVVRTTEKILKGGLRGPVGDVVVITSIDTLLLQRDPRIRSAWWDVVHAPTGPYVLERHFPVPALAKLVDGIWVAPEITVWSRRDSAQRSSAER